MDKKGWSSGWPFFMGGGLVVNSPAGLNLSLQINNKS